jgi:hypothetical protein
VLLPELLPAVALRDNLNPQFLQQGLLVLIRQQETLLPFFSDLCILPVGILCLAEQVIQAGRVIGSGKRAMHDQQQE